MHQHVQFLIYRLLALGGVPALAGELDTRYIWVHIDERVTHLVSSAAFFGAWPLLAFLT